MKTLGIRGPILSLEDIRRARIKAIKLSHPDVGGSKEDMADVYEAVEYLEKMFVRK